MAPEVSNKTVNTKNWNTLVTKSKLDSSYLNVNDNFKKDVFTKYNEMVKEFGEQKAQTKIKYYAQGLKFNLQELVLATKGSGKILIDGVKEALSEGSMEKFIAAFHEAAKSYIAFYDNNNDGRIDIEEFMAAEEKELGRPLTNREKAIVQEEALNRIAILNQYDNSETGDVGQLDENEIAAYLWTMSKINDGANGKTAYDITAEEWNTSQEAMGIISGTDMTAEEGKLVTKAFNIIGKTKMSLENLYELEDLSSLNNITPQEIYILEEALPILFDNGFTQEMIDSYALFAAALKNGYEGLKQ